jgi:hypothetical protein
LCMAAIVNNRCEDAAGLCSQTNHRSAILPRLQIA